MATGEEEEERGSLEVSPTWAVAVVCSVFVIASFAAERGLHYAGKWLKRHDKKYLNQALEKVKAELMLLGFISLLLEVFQPVVAGICMPHSFLDHMLPCRLNLTEYFKSTSEGTDTSHLGGEHGRKLLTYSIQYKGQHSIRRFLSSNGSNSKCLKRDKVPFLSIEAIHQLHIFIFVLAIVHLVYSVVTMVLGRIKIHSWNIWEKEAHIKHFNNFEAILAVQPEFLQKHVKRPWSSSVVLSWMVAFVRQFGKGVTRTDYLTLRVGFINTHKVDSNFDFHDYVHRVLQDDFKRVVGIRAYLWAFVVVFLLLNVQGWHTYFWIAFLPLFIILFVGSKLQHVITTLAFDIVNAQSNVGPAAAIQPRDELFWFRRPELVLHLLHFTLFQNAFELAFFFWIWATFGFDSCYMDNLGFMIVRLVIGVIVQVLCSYSTLPLYALVTQMGTHYKAAIFEEHITEALTGLHERIKRKKKKDTLGGVIRNKLRNRNNPIPTDKHEEKSLTQDKESPLPLEEQGELQSPTNNEIEPPKTSLSIQMASLPSDDFQPR